MLGGLATSTTTKLLTCLEDALNMLANNYECCEKRLFQSDYKSLLWFYWLFLQGCC